MTREKFREVLEEYGVSMLTSVVPEKITEDKLRKLLEALIGD